MADIVKASGWTDLITKLANVKDADIAKIEKLMLIQQDWQKRQDFEHFNNQLTLMQAALDPIQKDCVNPVTRSKYASLLALLEAMRPILGKYGFSITFNEDFTHSRDNFLLLYADVSCGAETRRFYKGVPISTTGLAGRAAMTPTHASIAAVTYGRRVLLKMIGNIAEEEDDDGNLVGGRTRIQDPFPKEPGNGGNNYYSLEGLISKLEGCKSESELNSYGASLKNLSLFPPDRDKLVAKFTELKAKFKKGRTDEHNVESGGPEIGAVAQETGGDADSESIPPDHNPEGGAYEERNPAGLQKRTGRRADTRGSGEPQT